VCALLALSSGIKAEEQTPVPQKKQQSTSKKGIPPQLKKAPSASSKAAVVPKTGPAAAATTATHKPSSTRKGTRTAGVRTRQPAVVRQQTPSVQRYTEIQQALADKGHYKGPVNGQWGPESVEALKSFQAEQHLEVDGKLGALSLIALGLGPQHTSSAQLPSSGKPAGDQSPGTEPRTPSAGQSQ
jgi:peptidoglycan hydrolase-like protein with peptidoglycan-binding domain